MRVVDAALREAQRGITYCTLAREDFQFNWVHGAPNDLKKGVCTQKESRTELAVTTSPRAVRAPIRVMVLA
jgi:hypothetical protein